MTIVGRVERRILRVEGFPVSIHHLSGANVRSDRGGFPPWPYERAAKDAWSVAEWKRERFAARYPGFIAEVLDTHGVALPGQTRLESVRRVHFEAKNRRRTRRSAR